MEINIQLHNSIMATVTIDGRPLTFKGTNLSAGGSSWGYAEAMTTAEMQSTIGGMIAYKLMDVLPMILQGHIPETHNPATGKAYGTWDQLDEDTADKIYEELS